MAENKRYELAYENEDWWAVRDGEITLWKEEVVDKLNEQEHENRLLKITYAKCRDCKHADLYNPEFAYPYLDPICELGIKKIHSDSNACEDFVMIGRNSR